MDGTNLDKFKYAIKQALIMHGASMEYMKCIDDFNVDGDFNAEIFRLNNEENDRLKTKLRNSIELYHSYKPTMGTVEEIHNRFFW